MVAPQLTFASAKGTRDRIFETPNWDVASREAPCRLVEPLRWEGPPSATLADRRSINVRLRLRTRHPCLGRWAADWAAAYLCGKGYYDHPRRRRCISLTGLQR